MLDGTWVEKCYGTHDDHDMMMHDDIPKING